MADVRAVIHGWLTALVAATHPDLSLMGLDEMEQLAEDGNPHETTVGRLRPKREARDAAPQARGRAVVLAEVLATRPTLLKRFAQVKFGPAAVEKFVGTVAATDSAEGMFAVTAAIIICEGDAELIACLDEIA